MQTDEEYEYEDSESESIEDSHEQVVFSRKGQILNIQDKRITLGSEMACTSALGFLANNPEELQDGDHVADDGYIYDARNQRIRKWFSPRPGWKHFWKPAADDLYRLELVVERLNAYYQKYWKKHLALWRYAWDNFEHINGEAVFHTQSGDYYIVHRISEGHYYGDGKSLSHSIGSRRSDDPEEPRHLEFGAKFKRSEEQSNIWREMYLRVWELLREQLQKRLEKELEPIRLEPWSPVIYEVRLRKSYLFKVEQNPHGGNYKKIEYLTTDSVRILDLNREARGKAISRRTTTARRAGGDPSARSSRSESI